MSKVKWDSFDRVAVIVTPTGLSDVYGPYDVYGPSGLTSVDITDGVLLAAESKIRYYAVGYPVAFEDPMTKSWVELFESAPDSIDVVITCSWGAADPLTMDVELRLMDAEGNDVSVGIQSINRSAFSLNGGNDEATVTFNTSGMFSTGEDTGAAGHYLFRTGDMTGISLPAPEPFPPPPPPPPPVTSGYTAYYAPPQPMSTDSPSMPTGESLALDGYILTRYCSYDGLNKGFDNGITCQWVRIPQENVYYFKSMKDLEKNIDRYQGRDSFRDPTRAGFSENTKVLLDPDYRTIDPIMKYYPF